MLFALNSAVIQRCPIAMQLVSSSGDSFLPNYFVANTDLMFHSCLSLGGNSNFGYADRLVAGVKRVVPHNVESLPRVSRYRLCPTAL